MSTKVLLCLIFILVFVSIQVIGEPVVIRIGTMVPEGSAWVKCLRNIDKESLKKINVHLIIYAGGTAGEAKAVLEKMGYGQLDGGGFVASTLGGICPKLRIMDIPFKYSSLKEWRYVFKKIRSDLARDFKKANYVVLGWSYGGFVDLYSQQPLRTLEDFRSAKVWFSPGDPLMEGLFRELKISGIPLGTSGIFPALQTGLVNCVYNTPYGLMAIQWHINLKYRTHYPIVNPLGAIVITRKAYQRIPSRYRRLFMRICRKHFSRLGKEVSKNNKRAREDLTKRFHFTTIEPDENWLKLTIQVGAKIAREQIGRLYSQAFYDKVERLQRKFRRKHKK